MGLNIEGTRFLLHAHKQGVDFSHACMLGRQGLHLSVADLSTNLQSFGFNASLAGSLFTEPESCTYRTGFAKISFCEPLLRLLGAQEIVSFDSSAAEKATYVHDFNYPLGEEFSDRFSMVLDSGTLEHIFNFPVAIANCMKMVRPGGHLLINTPANGQCGHGLYQFCPDLFYRVLTPENGFVVRSMVTTDGTGKTAWKGVSDPNGVPGCRVMIQDPIADMLIIAQKTATVPLFTQTVRQSDYLVGW